MKKTKKYTYEEIMAYQKAHQNDYRCGNCDADELGICSGECQGCFNHSHFRPIGG